MHIDFAGPFMDRIFLLLVDAHSKWSAVIDMAKCTTATSTIAVLRHIFAMYGLPEQVVSNNSPQFTSEVFKKFLLVNGVKYS